MLTTLFCCVILIYGIAGAPAGDEVTSLPGLTQSPPWKHYSGYLQASKNKHLHYWFIESANKPATDPLVVWMNGGPGCSSDLGLLTEHGPFRIAKDGSSVYYNKYSWNNVANMLYLEAPAGVGFSYDDNKSYATDDDQVAENNYLALKYFFKIFPEYKSNNFFITGESYGGIYVPTLSSLVMDDKSINFKGMAIGNGITNFDTNSNSLLYFGYYHGIIGESAWTGMLKACCPGGNASRQCNFVKSYTQDPTCSSRVKEALGLIYNGGIDTYNLYAPCEVSKFGGYTYNNNTLVYDLPSYAHRTHPFMVQRLNKIKIKAQNAKSVRLTPPCLDYSHVIKYMNTEAVRKALHIPVFVQNWDVCSAIVGMGYKTIYQDTTKFYQKVTGAGKKVLVYNGDVDMACNFLGDEWFVERLNLTVIAKRSAWHYKDETGTQQVAGYTKQFKSLTLTTIKGAGHMVPQDKPVPALEMFSSFVHDN